MSFTELVQEVCNICKEAADRIMEIYTSGFTVDNKQDNSPLTNADIASHKTICAGLSEILPRYPVLSEESADIPFSERQTWERYWLIDPLDGTREFIKKNGEFTINIALIEHHEPVLGVVHIPVSGVTYYATKGQGAFKRSPNTDAVPIKVKPTTADKITIAGSRSHSNEKQQSFIDRLGNVEIHAIGSSLKFCLVAEGIVDIYPRFGPTSEWDTAAAQCIVEEAGGSVVDLDYEKLTYNSKPSLLNPEFLVIADKSFDWDSYIR